MKTAKLNQEGKDFIEFDELIRLENSGHVLFFHTRKFTVCINGFRYYKISPLTYDRYREYVSKK